MKTFLLAVTFLIGACGNAAPKPYVPTPPVIPANKGKSVILAVWIGRSGRRRHVTRRLASTGRRGTRRSLRRHSGLRHRRQNLLASSK